MTLQTKTKNDNNALKHLGIGKHIYINEVKLKTNKIFNVITIFDALHVLYFIIARPLVVKRVEYNLLLVREIRVSSWHLTLIMKNTIKNMETII